MSAPMVLLQGNPADQGRAHGEVLRPAVCANVTGFWYSVTASGHDRRAVHRAAVKSEDMFSDRRLAEIAGIAQGAGLEYPDVLAYQCFQNVICPDDCTVAFAAGKASATGDTIFFKNSDKVGGATLVGPNFFRMKEINVLLAVRAAAGHLIIGAAAAGSTGMKMGVSSLGIAAGANISRTEAMFQRHLDLTQIRAVDRAQLLRDALEQPTALAACQDTVGKILANPMASSGNLEYADADTVYIVEGSYSELGQQTVRDDVGGRSNMFVLLKDLNAWHDVSSKARYIRLMTYLGPKRGQVTFEDMLELAVDHTNGPGPNSICRHGVTPAEEVSLCSMVVATNRAEPTKTRVAFSLGKPCHAWRHPAGQLHFTMDIHPGDIPAQFTNGDVWRQFYNEEAQTGAHF